MDNPNPIYYKDLITPDDSITKLIAQLNELISTYEAGKQKIQGAAAEVAKGMQGVSGATEEQRKQIQLATEATDKLTQEYKDALTEEDRLLKMRREANEAFKEEMKVRKLVEQATTSAEGSYNKLSAQYRLNKIRLNEMSAAERFGTEAGRQLEAETNAIYEEMKRLQEATGKHQLNVGNYADAAKGLTMELRSLVQQMAYLKMEGKENSEEYQELAARAGQLKDAMLDSQNEVKALASDTANLDSVSGAAGAASGGMAALTSTMSLMGATSEGATKAQKTLGLAVGALSGLTAVQNALQKESNVMLGIGKIQALAKAKADAVATAAVGKNTVAVVAATAAQKVFNAVANANPYVLLAVALISVVGALVAFTVGTSKAAEQQDKLNKSIAAHLEHLQSISDEYRRVSNERVRDMQDELDVLKARKGSLQEQWKLEDKIYEERRKEHFAQMGFYADELASEEANRAKLAELQSVLERLRSAQATGDNKVWIDVDLDGKIEKVKVDKAIEAVQGQIDNIGKKVEIAVGLRTEGKDIEKERKFQLEQRKDAAKAAKDAEISALRAEEDARIALIAENYAREMAQLKANSDRRIADLRRRMSTETNITVKARKAMQQQILSITQKFNLDARALQQKYFVIDLQARRTSEDLAIELMEEGAEKERKVLMTSYTRRINDLQRTLATDTSLSVTQREELLRQIELLTEKFAKEQKKLDATIAADALKREKAAIDMRIEATKEGSEERIKLSIESLEKQRDIELAENALLSKELQQNEADIRAKWTAKINETQTKMASERAMMLLSQEQELAASEFALLDKNERQKSQFLLRQERARLVKQLELNKTASVKLTEEQVKTIKNTIALIDKEVERLPYNNLWDLLGIDIDSGQQQAMNTAISAVSSSISSLIDSWTQAAEAAVQSANKQVEAAKKVVDAEIEARNNGYANNVEMAQKELDLARRNQERAVKEQKKAQQAQLAIDSITQASSLITATANIWSAFSKFPPLAIATTALMWGSFAAAKIKAFQVTAKQSTEQYGEGTVELLQGGSHASGNDIDLGTKADGTRRRAEGGEFFAVINKRNSRRYRNVIPDVINSLNDGTFASRYQRASDAMNGYTLQMGVTDVSGIEKDVSAIRRNGERAQYVDAQGNTVVRYKNLTRKILS